MYLLADGFTRNEIDSAKGKNFNKTQVEILLKFGYKKYGNQGLTKADVKGMARWFAPIVDTTALMLLVEKCKNPKQAFLKIIKASSDLNKHQVIAIELFSDKGVTYDKMARRPWFNSSWHVKAFEKLVAQGQPKALDALKALKPLKSWQLKNVANGRDPNYEKLGLLYKITHR